MNMLKSLLFIASYSLLCLSAWAEEAPKSKQIFESKSLSIWYYQYPNLNYPDEYGSYKYFWIGFQARGKHSDPDCIFKEAQIVTELNFSFQNLNKSFTFTKNCPHIAVTGDTGFELKKYFTDEELQEIKKQPQLLNLTVLKSQIIRNQPK